LNDRLVTRAAIEDLVHTYALLVRRAEGGKCIDLFTEDAVFEVREAFVRSTTTPRTRSRLEGRQAIANYVARSAAPDTRVCPFIYNLLIGIGDHQATSTCLMTSLVWSSGQQIVGEYQDTYQYDTRWRFSSRLFTMLGEFAMTATARSVLTP
jgi:hypothetical protein